MRSLHVTSRNTAQRVSEIAQRDGERTPDACVQALEGGSVGLMTRYMSVPVRVDEALRDGRTHILQHAMKLDRALAYEAHTSEAAFLEGAAACTRMLAMRSNMLLTPTAAGVLMATEAFNFIGAGTPKQPDNMPMRREVVLATLFKQLTETAITQGHRRSEQRPAPQLPLFKPDVKALALQAGSNSREVQGKMAALHNMVADELAVGSSSYIKQLVVEAKSKDPAGFRYWTQKATVS